ncbi:alkaline phosphatase D family protein [Brevundimonas sp.]|uniref:alkaline phosphatase D family protein n=1 Tax=Brevundimonas sp. TaxID=1871086 RepID=UPI0025D73FD1|nr:alkaline phosphatase D family protein [Brevundimonas sp.]
MRIDRRQALGLIGAGAATSACATPSGPSEIDPSSFRHGVAAGDPSQDSIVLWTRLTFDSPGPPYLRHAWVEFEVSEDEGFERVVQSGLGMCRLADDWTFKVLVTGLQAGRDYWYRFNSISPVGRFRTLPAEESTDEVVLAVASCSLHPGGYFNAYRAIAGLERVDAVVHLGDYIYEYGAGPTDYGMRTGLELGRIPEPAHEIVTLADYRARHAQYKADPDLQAAHARAAWIMTFDDHEVTNDPWEGGAENHDEGEGSWADRKAAALRAYLEWNPIREPAAGTPLHEAVRRSFQFGRSAALHMVETRLSARSEQLEYEHITAADGSLDRSRLDDPDRRLMGEAQLDWLGEALGNDAAWQVLGNQVLMARMVVPDITAAVGPAAIEAALPSLQPYQQRRLTQMAALGAGGFPMNLDAWDGYPAERDRLYARARSANARLVVLSGDSHCAWANTLSDARGRLGVEFGATAVSSPVPSYAQALPGAPLAEIMAAQNPEVEWCDFGPRGFFVLSLTPQAAECRMIGLSTIASRDFETEERARFRVEADGAGLGTLTRVA